YNYVALVKASPSLLLTIAKRTQQTKSKFMAAVQTQKETEAIAAALRIQGCADDTKLAEDSERKVTDVLLNSQGCKHGSNHAIQYE
ncbi:1352_t:CDS:2, partial [Paraglomus occultum]